MKMDFPSSPNQLVRNEDEWPRFLVFFTSLRELVGHVLVLVPRLSPNHMLLAIK